MLTNLKPCEGIVYGNGNRKYQGILVRHFIPPYCKY